MDVWIDWLVKKDFDKHKNRPVFYSEKVKENLDHLYSVIIQSKQIFIISSKSEEVFLNLICNSHLFCVK